MSKVRADNITNRADDGAPTLPYGANIVGIVSATGFVGDVTGDVTGNATGLSGSPDITVGIVTSSELDGYVMLDTSLF